MGRPLKKRPYVTLWFATRELRDSVAESMTYCNNVLLQLVSDEKVIKNYTRFRFGVRVMEK